MVQLVQRQQLIALHALGAALGLGKLHALCAAFTSGQAGLGVWACMV